MFNPSELQEHLNSLDESLIESAALEPDLVTKLSSELSELTNPLVSTALESKLSASIDSTENESTDHDFGRPSSTDNFSLQFNDLILGNQDSFKSFTPTLEADTSFVLAQQASGIANHGLGLSAAPAPKGMGIVGSLEADTFTFQAGYDFAVFSGNGNINYGSGARDLLDLSNVSSSTVTASNVLFDPGNGTRVFDAITLSDGSDILFEGIDQIQFVDGTLDLSITPNDPLFESQWNLHMMGVHNAWRFTTGSDEVLIGVQDTGLGVDSSGDIHPDLPSTTIFQKPGQPFFNYPDEFTGQTTSHGTGVQGIISAISDNRAGMSGINWNSPVYNIDVLGSDTGDLSLAQATQAMIDYANSNGQQLVINMSLGGRMSIGAQPDFEQLVANNQDDVLFVIATGNGTNNGGDSSLLYPAVLANVYDNVVAVGASWGTHDVNGNPTIPGERISYPGVWGSNYGEGITLMGPSEVISTRATASGTMGFDYNPQFDGTSAATPNVAGVASLVWSANSDLAAGDIKTILSQTAYDLGTPGYDLVYGHGFVNADAAVRRAMALDSSTTMNQAGDPLSATSNFAMNPAMGTDFDLLAV